MTTYSLSSLGALSPTPEPTRTVGGDTQPAAAAGVTGPFENLLRQFVAQANVQDIRSTQAIQDFALGKDENVHNLMLAVTKSDLTFRMFLQVRNRLTDALQQILQMQV